MGLSRCVVIAHAIAELNMTNEAGEKLMHILVEQSAPWLVQDGTPHYIALPAWATAKLRFPAPALLAKVQDRAAWLIEKGNTQDISKIVWAFAELRVDATHLLSELEREAEWFRNNCTRLELAVVLLACETTLRFDATNLSKKHQVSYSSYDRAIMLDRENDGYTYCKRCATHHEDKYFREVDPKTQDIIIREVCDGCRSGIRQYRANKLAELQDCVPDGQAFCKNCWAIKDIIHFQVQDATTNQMVVRKTCNPCRESNLRSKAKRRAERQDSAPDGQAFCKARLTIKDDIRFQKVDPIHGNMIIRKTCIQCRSRTR